MLEANLEDLTNPPIQQPEPIPEQNSPHDSAEVYSQLFNKHTKLVFPTLDTKEKGKGTTIILIAIVAGALFSAWGVSYGIQYELTPRVPGTCTPPAIIQSGGCFIVETATGANGNQITTLVPAGTLRP